MPQPTPADDLRAAAALLREAAGHATPGPWRTHDTHLGGAGGHTATVLTDRPNINDTELIAWLPTMSHEPWDETRNAWRNAGSIALMHPGVGAAVADWLDAAAVAYDATVKGAAGVWSDPADAAERDAWVAKQTDQQALAVARQVLGTTTDTDTTHRCDNCDGVDPDTCLTNPDRATVPPVADRADLRDRIRLACAEADGVRYDDLEPWDYQTHADKLMAVLPAPTDQAAVRCTSCEHETRYHDVGGRCWFTVGQGAPERDSVCACLLREHMEGDDGADRADLRDRIADAVLAVLPAPTDGAADRYRTAWHNARSRAAVLSAEITRRAPLLGEYAAQIANLRTMYDVAAARTSDLIDERDQLLEAITVVEALPVPDTSPGWALGAAWALAQIRRLADEAQQPTTAEAADLLADCATEYRVPVPENGGTELRLRRGTAPHAAGWSVAVPGYGGGMALTELGWSDRIGALSADRLFCWPDPATAVDAARRALATAAPTEEPTP